MKPIRALVFLAALLALAGVPSSAAAAAQSYPGYLYSYDKESYPSPLPYLPARVIRGSDLGTANFVSPDDLYIGRDGTIYVADTGNNRIVLFDEQLRLKRVIDSFLNDGSPDTFNGPQGVFADPDNGHIVVADTLNQRVVELDADGTLVNIIRKPESSIIRSNFQYTPIKVARDKSKRVYVISKSAYEGILEFDADGQFIGFIGTNRVRFNPVDLLWKRISTREQREQMKLFIPLEFNNIDVDQDGFLYTTTTEADSDEPIKRLNPSGEDILRREGRFPPKGDLEVLEIGSTPGGSVFVDVVADDGGIYSALDSKRGRIFTYDKDGNMLHQFGGIGSQAGRFKQPVALDTLNGDVYVLDKGLGTVTVFSPTPYGSAIRNAVIAHYNGEMERAAKEWEQVLRFNRNNEIAYVGIGKALLKQDRNAEAMTYFKLGNNRKYYSEAFKRYREQWIERNFGYLFGAFVSVIGAAVVSRRLLVRRWAHAHYREIAVWRNPFYTMLHPFNGFWEMKFENKGRLKIALGILLALVVTVILKRQFSAFIVNDHDPDELNSLRELMYVVLPFLLWCVGNWSLTTLMDGEGKFREIVMATGYALLPLIVIYLPQMAFSHVMTLEESAFYDFLDVIAVLWFVWLLFVGTMTVHQYSVGKTIATMLLTVVMIGIILFLGLLLFSVVQQMVSFVGSVYREMTFRV